MTTILRSNRSYAILNVELARVCTDSRGPKTLSLPDFNNPSIRRVTTSEEMDVPAKRVETFFSSLSGNMAIDFVFEPFLAAGARLGIKARIHCTPADFLQRRLLHDPAA